MVMLSSHVLDHGSSEFICGRESTDISGYNLAHSVSFLHRLNNPFRLHLVAHVICHQCSAQNHRGWVGNVFADCGVVSVDSSWFVDHAVVADRVGRYSALKTSFMLGQK